ncbi:MAG: efflux RND transporter periplasmic adaptor subunit [Gemmatimonadetes bacterium]|nr:efflux RND transporter periplasmic adaptor subunit [Gemmatimonadota bacterium]
MKIMMTRELAAVALIVLATMGLTGCGGEEQAEAAPVARPVSTVVVGQGFAGRLTFPGTVQAAERAEMSFRVAGPLVGFPVNEGDQVSRGQLLARIDPRDYRIAVTEAKAAFDQANSDADRYQRLYEREAIPLAELEVRLSRRDVAQARYEQARADLRDTELRAPFAGQIGRTYVENFEDVRARELVLSLHQMDNIEVVINVPEAIMASVRQGRAPSIAVLFDVAPEQPYTARIKEFAVSADPQTQTFAVTVTLPQPQDINVLPGMTATVGVTGTLDVDAAGSEPLTVPAAAVFSDEEGASNLWVVDEAAETVHRRPVRVGSVTGTEGIVVLEGLEPGERVVTAGVQFLREGQQIRLVGGMER